VADVRGAIVGILLAAGSDCSPWKGPGILDGIDTPDAP
jgi:hypothetical protein